MNIYDAFLVGDAEVKLALAQTCVKSPDADYGSILMVRAAGAADNFVGGALERDLIGPHNNRVRGLMMAWLYVNQDEVSPNRDLVWALGILIRRGDIYSESALEILRIYVQKTKTDSTLGWVIEVFFEPVSKRKYTSDLPAWMDLTYRIHADDRPHQSCWRDLLGLYEAFEKWNAKTQIELWTKEAK